MYNKAEYSKPLHLFNSYYKQSILGKTHINQNTLLTNRCMNVAN